jgi:hypothetical protein
VNKTGPSLTEKSLLRSSAHAKLPLVGAQTMSSRRFHGRGLLYAAIPVLAGAYSGFEVATAALERQHTVNRLTIFVPRLSLAFVLGLMVYGLFRAVGSLLKRLHGVALAAQPTWQFITSKPSAPLAGSLTASPIQAAPSGHVSASEHLLVGT